MKRNLVAVVLLLALAVVSSGCVAGPWTFRETVDDWSADVYADNTYLGTVVYVFVWPIGTWIGSLVDAVVFNNIAFWGSDVWDGTGTTDPHENAPKGRTNEKGKNALMDQPNL